MVAPTRSDESVLTPDVDADARATPEDPVAAAPDIERTRRTIASPRSRSYALTVLAVAMMMLARLSYLTSQRGRMNDLIAKRNAALAQEATRYGVMAFPDLAADAAAVAPGVLQTRTMLVGDFSFVRRVLITMPGTNRYTITVGIAPIASEFRTDSVTFRRTRPATGSPLCMTC